MFLVYRILTLVPHIQNYLKKENKMKNKLPKGFRTIRLGEIIGDAYYYKYGIEKDEFFHKILGCLVRKRCHDIRFFRKKK